MIASFADRATEALYHGIRGKSLKHFPPEILAVGVRKLDMLNSARSLQDRMAPPGNHYEQLHGKLKRLHSIRINAQWRVVFRWESGCAYDVRVVDYHH